MNSVTNIAGAMIVSEVIKLLTGAGSVCKYPKAFDIDLYNNTSKVIHLYSPFRWETVSKLLSLNKGKERFAEYIANRKRKAGL